MMNVRPTWEAREETGCLITDAECSCVQIRDHLESRQPSQSGQSILEFMLMLPMMIGMTVILTRLNSAIQTSIVDQQYARAQTLFLTFNSAFYPELEKKESLIRKSANQMVVGVSENVAPERGDYSPEASVQLVARSRKIQASDAPGEEPDLRAKVRIRNSVTLCTESLFLSFGGRTSPILPMIGPRPAGPNILAQQTKIDNFCESRIKYVE